MKTLVSFIRQNNKILFALLKGLIFILTLLYLYHELKGNKVLIEFMEILSNKNRLNYGLLLTSIFLIPFNYGIESWKWRFLLKNIQPISFLRSYMAVLSGVSVSILLPNRVGDYFGRIFYLQSTKRIKAILATIVGSFAQLIIAFSLGSIAFTYYFWNKALYPGWQASLLTVSSMVVLGAMFLYYNIPLIYRLVSPSNKRLKKVRQYLKVFTYYHSDQLTELLILSLSRFLVFSIQYVLILKAFGIETTYLTTTFYVVLIFFIQSVIPSVALADLGIRGAVAVYIFSFVGENQLAVLVSSLVLWIVNIIIPAVTGSVLLVFQRND